MHSPNYRFTPVASPCYAPNIGLSGDTLWAATYTMMKHKQPDNWVIPDEDQCSVRTLRSRYLDKGMDIVRAEIQALKLFMVITDLWESPVNQINNRRLRVEEADTTTIVYIRADQHYEGSIYASPIVYFPREPKPATSFMTAPIDRNTPYIMSSRQTYSTTPKAVQLNMLIDPAYLIPHKRP